MFKASGPACIIVIYERVYTPKVIFKIFKLFKFDF